MIEDKITGGKTEHSSIAGQRNRLARQRQASDTFDGNSTDGEVDVAALLAAAEKRDKLAEARDTTANHRDMSANLDAFLSDGSNEKEFEQREAARKDRAAAREDRLAAAGDREALTHQHRPAT